MATTTLPPTPRTGATPPPEATTARTAGVLYLGLGIAGMLGFLVVRPRIFDPDSPAATLAHVLGHQGLFRVGIALELTMVVAQVLTALWLLRLLASVDRFLAVATCVLGLMNAVALLVSAVLLVTVLDAATRPLGEQSTQLVYAASENAWAVGNLFFGLWLVPMGVAVLRSGWTHRLLGWLLVGGGGGYVLHGYLAQLAPSAGPMAELLVVPPTIAEFWMIGWLLTRRAHGTIRPADAP